MSFTGLLSVIIFYCLFFISPFNPTIFDDFTNFHAVSLFFYYSGAEFGMYKFIKKVKKNTFLIPLLNFK